MQCAWHHSEQCCHGLSRTSRSCISTRFPHVLLLPQILKQSLLNGGDKIYLIGKEASSPKWTRQAHGCRSFWFSSLAPSGPLDPSVLTSLCPSSSHGLYLPPSVQPSGQTTSSVLRKLTFSRNPSSLYDPRFPLALSVEDAQ